MQFREACYTVVSYAPYILLQIYTITILATFQVTIFDFFHPWPQPSTNCAAVCINLRNQTIVTPIASMPADKFPLNILLTIKTISTEANFEY